MNRQEFMNQLEYLLRGIPNSERDDALAYYNNYFDEAGVENEQQVIMELGSPEAVAENIIADSHHESDDGNYQNDYSCIPQETTKMDEKKKKINTVIKILIIVLLVITSPLWLGIVTGLFGAIVGIIGAFLGIAVGLIGVNIGLLVGGIMCIVVGIARFAFSAVEALAMIGIGAFLTSIGLLIGLLWIWCVGVWIPKLVKVVIGWIKNLIHHIKGGK